MSSRRLHRLSTTIVMVLSLLFSQLALAQYVCPRQADVEAMVAMMEAGQPCEGMDPDQPVLCHQHTSDPAKTFEAVKLLSVGQPAMLQVLVRPLALDAQHARALPTAATPEARPPPDPLFLATLRLRV